ncbi:MAG: amino acid ABC transporter permease, partial [Lachnospiraceae bacterium]|nr:amino acid ABC transporter permease [Lachnospiraceae bacterium]
ILSAISKVYISFIRGTPMMIQIYLIYYLIPRLVNRFVELWQLNFDIYAINTMVYAYIVFSLHAGATLGEVFRGALSTAEKGQVEAAYAIGMTGWQTFHRVIFPQSIVVAIPNICTNFINILKATSLVFSMAILDITGVAKVAANESYKFLEAYLAILLVYVIICYIAERLFKHVEKAVGKYRLAA